MDSYITKDWFEGAYRGRLSDREYAELKQAFVDAMKAVINQGLEIARSGDLQKSMSPDFMPLVGQIAKDISLTSPLSTGFVPFDLQAPAKLLYPVFTPLRNRLPRTKGQGQSRRAKRVLGISGSGTAGIANTNPFVTEFPSGQGFGNWPMSPNASVSMAADDLVVPYKIMALDHNVSFMAQFLGQGFQDITGLATLTLLQSMMLLEERALIAGRTATLSAPGTPTLAARSATTGETALSGYTTNIYVKVTAVTPFGETAGSPVASVAPSSGQVVDVTIPNVPGAFGYKVYVSTGGTDPGDSARRYMASTAWSKVTLQGALPTGGPTVPTSDTGTGDSKMYDGLAAILSGGANSTYDPNNLGVYTGYYKRLNDAISVTALQTALAAMWDSQKARPQEVWANAIERKALSDSILAASGQTAAYRIMVEQGEVGGVAAAAVVTAIYNEATGDKVDLSVHPWLDQGNVLILSYTLPFPYTEVPNAYEVVNVQDYMSIAWPTIDARFRYSIYVYGALVAYAPQYSGLIQGVAKSASAPYA